MVTETASTQRLKHIAPWLPIALVVFSASTALLLRAGTSGNVLSAVWWTATAVSAGFIGARLPGRALVALVFLLPVAPYVRYDTWLGKELPFVIAAAVLVGVTLSPETYWTRLLRDQRRHIATPVLAFAALLTASVVLVLVQRSQFVMNLAGAGWASGYFSKEWVSLIPQSTLPILRSGRFLLGPICGLALLSLLNRVANRQTESVTREGVLAAVFLTSVLNLSVACGQFFLPDFPIPPLYEPVAGLFHNPVGLALLMTLVAPVALAVSLRPTRIPWLRPLAMVTVALVALMFVPLQQRSAHLGVLAGITCFLVPLAFVLVQRDKKHFRRIVIATVATTILLSLVLAAGFATINRNRGPGNTQWQQTWTAISNRPFSMVWLGIGVRQQVNRLGLLMANDRPLGGYGIGGFEAARASYHDRYGPPCVQFYLHCVKSQPEFDHSLLNHPLHMLTDLGVFGLTTNLWLLVAFLFPPIRKVLIHLRSENRETKIDLTAVGCVAGVVAAALLSLWTGEWLYDATISVVAFMLLALAAPKFEPAQDDRPRLAIWAILAFPLAHGITFILGV